jgi:hypothetical protein
MILSEPLAPKHADGVLRVYRPKRATISVPAAATVDAERRDEEAWLARVYAGPVAYIVQPDADRSMSSLRTMIVNGACDLVLVGELRDLSRNPNQFFMWVDACVDNEVRLIARNDGIDTASDGWETARYVAVLRLETERRRRRRVVAPKA